MIVNGIIGSAQDRTRRNIHREDIKLNLIVHMLPIFMSIVVAHSMRGISYNASCYLLSPVWKCCYFVNLEQTLYRTHALITRAYNVSDRYDKEFNDKY